MKRKKIMSFIAMLLAVIMLMSLFIGAIPMFAAADGLSELEQLRAEKGRLSYQVNQCRERLSALQQQQANVLEQKAAFDEEKRLATEQLKLIAKEIDKYKELIDKKAQEVDAAKNREAVQLERYRNRLRAMEENGNYDALAIVLKAESFGELLTAMDDMGQIMTSDKQLQDEYMQAREETERIKAQYEEEKTEYEANQAALKDERKQINARIKENDKILESLDGEIVKAIKEYQAAEAAEAAAAASVKQAVARYNAENAAAIAAAAAQQRQDAVAAAHQGVNPDGVASAGSFMWPVPSSTRVTSRFGGRSDPFTGASANHTGLDIDGFGNDGGDVVSAAGGVVVTAGYNDGYGNYVVVNHGGTSTLYAHLSGLNVTEGETVNQGQTVGYLGATGRATGTHLHFEVYEGDQRVDPNQYFSGLSYYNC